MNRTKTCELCGTEFSCGGLFGCWCDNVKTDSTHKELLSLIASDCVCPECLKRN
ncbi:MAG: cysteine-rich CWC family protein [Thermoplasmataceae archaeon]